MELGKNLMYLSKKEKTSWQMLDVELTKVLCEVRDEKMMRVYLDLLPQINEMNKELNPAFL